MNFIKQSTAYTFRLGPFLDSTDGDTEENALTIAAASVLLSKAGGTLAAKNDTTALTGTGANAHYTCVLNATDTNTLGELRVFCHITGALVVVKDFMVVPAVVYDALIAGTSRLPVQAGIRKNQALANFPFVMTDSTNDAPATGLTVSVTRSIDGGAFAAGTVSNIAETGNGAYQCDFGAGDLNGDTIIFRFTATGANDLFVSVVTEP